MRSSVLTPFCSVQWSAARSPTLYLAFTAAESFGAIAHCSPRHGDQGGRQRGDRATSLTSLGLGQLAGRALGGADLDGASAARAAAELARL